MAKATSAPAKLYSDPKVAQSLGDLLRYSNAEALKSRLAELTDAPSYAEGKMIYLELVRDLPTIHLEITTGVLDQMIGLHRREFQARLAEAASDALNTPLLFNGRPITGWGHGGGLVLVMNQDLEILGYYDGAGSERSIRAAIAKGITAWFLDAVGRGGDITDPKNVQYLKSIGVKVGFDPEKPHVYSGCIPPEGPYSVRFYFIGGHYYFNDNIVNELVEGTNTKITNDTMAGAAEMTLAYFTMLYATSNAHTQRRPLGYEFLDKILRTKDPGMIAVLS